MFSFGYDLFLHFGIPCDTIFSIIIFVWIFVYHVWVGNSCLISFQQQKHVAQVWESYAQRFYEDFMKEELVCYPTTKWDSSKAPILDPLQSRLLWSDQIWYENESDWFEGTLGPYIYVFSWNHQFWKMSSVMYYPDGLMPDRFSLSLTFPKSNLSKIQLPRLALPDRIKHKRNCHWHVMCQSLYKTSILSPKSIQHRWMEQEALEHWTIIANSTSLNDVQVSQNHTEGAWQWHTFTQEFTSACFHRMN